MIEKLSDNKKRLSFDSKTNEDKHLSAADHREIPEHKRDDGAR